MTEAAGADDFGGTLQALRPHTPKSDHKTRPENPPDTGFEGKAEDRASRRHHHKTLCETFIITLLWKTP
jgi:hypothetical protein